MLVVMEGRFWAQKEMGGRVGLAVWFRMCEKGVSFSRKNSVICKTEAFFGFGSEIFCQKFGDYRNLVFPSSFLSF